MPAFELLGRDQLARSEPALARVAHRLSGGLRLPNDETGDCHLFARQLAERAAALGARLRFGSVVSGLEIEGGRLVAVRLGEERVAVDACVVALGSQSPALLAPLGIRAPVYPVKGYSLMIPVRDEARAPVSTVLDETYKVALTRFDRRIRVGGMAELAGHDLTLRQQRRKTLEEVVSDLFPGAGDLGAAEFWTGLRPMTPDSTPIVGATPVAGLFLNTGHGTLGWTMAAGSGRLMADLVLGRRPDIDPEGLGIERHGRAAPLQWQRQPAT